MTEEQKHELELDKPTASSNPSTPLTRLLLPKKLSSASMPSIVNGPTRPTEPLSQSAGLASASKLVLSDRAALSIRSQNAIQSTWLT